MPAGSHAPQRRVHSPRTGRACAGFTLVEIMVVLAIIGLMSGVVALTLPDEAAALHRQADRFAGHLVRAREEAIMASRPVRVRVDAVGYGFERYGRDGWQPVDGSAFEARRWSEDVAPAFDPHQTQASFLFDPTGAAEPQALVLARGNRRVAVALDGGGRVQVDAGDR